MSEQVKNAIDGGLGGLKIREEDVAAILRRARGEKQTARKPRRNWGLVAAVAAVLVMVSAGAGMRILSGPPDVTPLDQPTEQVTTTPGDDAFLPVEAAEPVVSVTASEAIAIAERYVLEQYDNSVNLRDGAVYEIDCRWVRQEREGNTFRANFYEVTFRALNEYATEYAVRVKADSGDVTGCETQRGAGEGHTAQEILAGYARVYGADRRMWTQEQLRTYSAMLRKAQPGSRRWTDFLYLQSSYPSVAENAMTKEEILAAAKAELGIIAFEYNRDQGDRWKSLELKGELRARYISAWPNPVWKVAADYSVTAQDGCVLPRTMLIEIDSVTGDVLHVDMVDTLYAEQYESFLHTVIDALKTVETAEVDRPETPLAELKRIAAAYVRDTWGETRDINDAELFSCIVMQSVAPLTQCEYQLRYTSKGDGWTTTYALFVDWYGSVIAANRGGKPEAAEPFAGTLSEYEAWEEKYQQNDFAPTAPVLDWNTSQLRAWQQFAKASVRREEPEVRAFINTVYLADHESGLPADAVQAACDELHIFATTHIFAVLIGAEPNPVWKLAIEGDQGEYLVEVDSETLEVISAMRVNGVYESWYLPFVLTGDLKAAGVSLTWDVVQNYLTEPMEDHGTVGGMRIDHLYLRFKQLYGPNMGAWSQAQLRSFQEMAVLSGDYGYDLAVPCLRSTVYPDVPQDAISREQAALYAAQHLGFAAADGAVLTPWSLNGAVLIGTEDTPVWKVNLTAERKNGEVDVWLVEVNCMTGRIVRQHQDADGPASPGASYDYGTPQNLWFREIVLEKTIEECEKTWDCVGNG